MLGKRYFERLGCHPVALKENRERSEAVWLFAGQLATYWQETEIVADPFMRWPSIFWLPQHRPPEPGFFLSHFIARDYNKDLDALTLERWLRYAKRRLPVIERYAAFLYLLGDGGGIQGQDVQKLIQVYGRGG